MLKPYASSSMATSERALREPAAADAGGDRNGAVQMAVQQTAQARQGNAVHGGLLKSVSNKLLGSHLGSDMRCHVADGVGGVEAVMKVSVQVNRLFGSQIVCGVNWAYQQAVRVAYGAVTTCERCQVAKRSSHQYGPVIPFGWSDLIGSSHGSSGQLVRVGLDAGFDGDVVRGAVMRLVDAVQHAIHVKPLEAVFISPLGDGLALGAQMRLKALRGHGSLLGHG